IVSGLGNGIIKIWDLSSYLLLFNLTGHTSAVQSIEYLPDKYLASGDENGKIIIWNLLNQTKHTVLIHNGSVRSLILINHTTFASAASNSIKLWSIESFTTKLTIEDAHSSDIIGLRYFSNNLFSISSDGIVKSWHNFVLKLQMDINCNVSNFDIDSNGNLACGCINGSIRIYSIQSHSFLLINSFDHNKALFSLCFLESGYLVSGGRDGTLNVWNYSTSSNLLSFIGHASKVTALEHAGAQVFWSGAIAGLIRIWDNGTLIKTLNANSNVHILKYIAQPKSINETNTSIIITNSTSVSSFTTDKYNTDFGISDIHIETMSLSDLVIILSRRYDFTDCLLNCSNNGQCKLDTLINRFFCLCQENYYGSSCKLNIKPCSSNPCLNNGICSDVLTNNIFNYECQCSNEFYSGRNCELRKDVCFNETCSNRGNCFDLNHNAKCKCFSMYSGDKCEIESSDLKEIKRTIKATSILAIIIIFCFYGLLIILDIFCKSKKTKKNENDLK
ncbi:unnamed protein product, partial [Brachionus calyciflorus]